MSRTIDHELQRLARRIDATPAWWRFPSEEQVGGFLGAGEVFFVGDQPSTSPWPRHDRGRRLFYDGLVAAGLGDAHLTDLVKRRGRASALRDGLPDDFDLHLAFFREELALLQPRRVVAIGRLCEELLRAHVPEVRDRLAYVTHFAYAIRPPGVDDYPQRLAHAADTPTPPRRARRRTVDPRPTPSPPRTGGALVWAIRSVPPGARASSWTLRRDNRAHHHGVMTWHGGTAYLELAWRSTRGATARPVGMFALDLGGLLAGGFVRYEPAGTVGPRLRVRVVMRDDDSFALEVRPGTPHYPLPPAD